MDRLLFVGLYRLASGVLDALKVMRPETLLRWHRSAVGRRHRRILRLVVVNDRQADGLQADLRRVKDLAATQRYKSLAEGHRRRQIPRRHRGHPSAGKPRRLIASSPKIPHSSFGLPDALVWVAVRVLI